LPLFYIIINREIVHLPDPTSPQLTASIILTALDKGDAGPGTSILDLGTGTGMLGLGMALVQSDMVSVCT